MSVSSFYVQVPGAEFWNTAMTNAVIEASPINPEDETLPAYQRTDEYVKNYLKVLQPADYNWKTVRKAAWKECQGPSMKLTGDEYMLFYHHVDPLLPFPKNFIAVRLPWLESTGQADAIRKKFSIA